MIENLKQRLTSTQIKIGVAIALVLCLVTGIILYTSVNRYRFTGDAYFPVDSRMFDIKKGTTAILQQGDSFANIKVASSEEFEGTENVAFYKNEQKFVLLCPWEIVTAPVDGNPGRYRIGCFTEIEKSGRNVIVSISGKNQIANAVFLYNGTDTYVLLQDAVVSYGETEVSLPAFSYVVANYGNWIQYVNHETLEYGMNQLGTSSDVKIRLEDSGIDIHALSDQFEVDGRSYMLVSDVSFLNSFGE